MSLNKEPKMIYQIFVFQLNLKELQIVQFIFPYYKITTLD